MNNHSHKTSIVLKVKGNTILITDADVKTATENETGKLN